MKQFELTVLALVKKKVIVCINENDYKDLCDDDLTPQENAKMFYEDDKYYFFNEVAELTSDEETLHEEVIGVEELPKEQ